MKDMRKSAEEVVDRLATLSTLKKAAETWGEWARDDRNHFFKPFCKATGFSMTEALLYFVNERLSQIQEGGVSVRAEIQHKFDIPPSPGGDGDEWKGSK